MALKGDYIFTPIAFETFGPMGEDTKKIIYKIGKLLQQKTGEKRCTDFFYCSNLEKYENFVVKMRYSLQL